MLKWLEPFNNEQPYVKRNFILNLFDGTFFAFALSFVSLNTVFPVIVKKIGGSNIPVGLIPVLWTMGFNFPQIFIANFVSRYPYKKPVMLRTAMMQRIPWLFLALISFFLLGEINRYSALIIVLTCFTIAAIGGSINLPGWFDLIAKLTPVKIRGRLFAARAILGSLLGIIGGYVAKIVLDSISYPLNFSILFLITFLVMMISYIFISFLKEEIPNHPKQVLKYRDFLKQLPEILKRENNFRNFLIADSLLTFSLMSGAFFTIHALEKFNLSDGHAGTFTIIMMVSTIVGNVLFGFIADHHGHRINLFIAALSTFTACLLAVLVDNYFIYLLVFTGSAFTVTLVQLSRLPIVAEICSEEERPTYVALTNVITSPFSLSGILAGWLATEYGYNPVFILSGIFSFASMIWFLVMVKEPRKLEYNLSQQES